jgi:hypothetical protein
MSSCCTHVPFLISFSQVDKSCKYDDVPHVISYGRTYDLCGGISAPKVVRCTGSDGAEYKMLIKVCLVFFVLIIF